MDKIPKRASLWPPPSHARPNERNKHDWSATGKSVEKQPKPPSVRGVIGWKSHRPGSHGCSEEAEGDLKTVLILSRSDKAFGRDRPISCYIIGRGNLCWLHMPIFPCGKELQANWSVTIEFFKILASASKTSTSYLYIQNRPNCKNKLCTHTNTITKYRPRRSIESVYHFVNPM